MKDKIILFFATGAYVGYSPRAPGTLGTLWGVLIVLGLSRAGAAAFGLAAAAVTALAVYIAGEAARLMDAKDPKAVVIDEVAGMMVASFLLPLGIKAVILAFLLFRFFDILKPWPVNYIDGAVGGGAGIVLDDVAAGVYANIGARIIAGVLGWA
ncbi:MAG: phosphatidylglycerophosphatase A [Deltaproteobacteria bacterium]|nr:phosphatidylglycerophosphatase A [Deltaproteobacteria bacterium]